jgi:hypothetical protein
MAVEAIKVDLGAAIERCSGDTDLLSQVQSTAGIPTQDPAFFWFVSPIVWRSSRAAAMNSFLPISLSARGF